MIRKLAVLVLSLATISIAYVWVAWPAFLGWERDFEDFAGRRHSLDIVSVPPYGDLGTKLVALVTFRGRWHIPTDKAGAEEFVRGYDADGAFSHPIPVPLPTSGWFWRGIGINWCTSNDFGWVYEPTCNANVPREATARHIRVSAPFWMLITFTAAYPVWSLASFVWRWKKRRRLGLCRSCGYDLNGNVSGTCPECGTARIACDPER